MPIEGPMDSPEGDEPTTLSAVEPLPPGSDAEQVVDDLDARLRAQGSEEVEDAEEEKESEDTEGTTEKVSKIRPDDQPESSDGEPSEAPD